ncbi:MAG: hypothetical protein IJ405_07090 [Lachnospiraceae bacterium]|nr:hypothetical protein [Lachnospiraceae bacterium]
MAEAGNEYIVKKQFTEEKCMCQNVFKSEEKKQRREDFTRLFAGLATVAAQQMVRQPRKISGK